MIVKLRRIESTRGGPRSELLIRFGTNVFTSTLTFSLRDFWVGVFVHNMYPGTDVRYVFSFDLALLPCIVLRLSYRKNKKA